ncbi:Cytochrome C oxidase, cbb3-type, subunit III [Parapedobacter luteus]|uniref:Cytochrome C oxidase, cbb3-type, subunit III n=1 Tax=Parapedobacter luteus TaxID=623280 RepID=A0A1T5AQ04_9SPHI|nr:cytochrome c [Parapedobacter luteus]SKB37114.1 Cytochrome C oxidase, cbb3-type, subunit III [Parapedobacter luteus]
MRNTYIYGCAALLSVYVLFHSCQSEDAIRTAQYAVNGQKLYAAQCQNCHGAKGEGLGNLYPALTDSAFLLNHREQLACIIKNGLKDTITVHGQLFDGEMPPNPQLAPIEIAYVLTYVGNSFGNKMGIFTLEEINQALKACK